MSSLLVRTLSALVLAPPVLAAIWFGPPFSDLLILVAAAIVAWEWARICRGGARPALVDVPLLLGAPLSIVAWLTISPLAGFIALLAAGVTVAASRVAMDRSARGSLAGWHLLGTMYAALPLFAFLWLRGTDEAGRDLIVWLLLVVWSTDIGAFAAGRAIGGPRIWPRLSPKKTWAGLLGGIAAAAVVSVAVGQWTALGAPIALGLTGGLLAIVSQVGDFFESGVKRRFGVKDSGSLIPGHGGLLDRIDGLVAATGALALYLALGGSFT